MELRSWVSPPWPMLATLKYVGDQRRETKRKGVHLLLHVMGARLIMINQDSVRRVNMWMRSMGSSGSHQPCHTYTPASS